MLVSESCVSEVVSRRFFVPHEPKYVFVLHQFRRVRKHRHPRIKNSSSRVLRCKFFEFERFSQSPAQELGALLHHGNPFQKRTAQVHFEVSVCVSKKFAEPSLHLEERARMEGEAFPD